MALWLQSVIVVDRQATFTDTSTEISSMEVALCLQSVAVVNRQATFRERERERDSNRLQAQSYHHATYSGRSICKATYSGGSICESGLAVHESQDCRYRAITMLLILVEVSVKVACRSTTGRHRLQHRATYSGGSICESGLLVHNSHRAITMLLILVEVGSHKSTVFLDSMTHQVNFCVDLK